MVIHKISTFILPLPLSQVPSTHIPIPLDSQQACGENPFGYHTEDEGCQLSRPHHTSDIIPVWQWWTRFCTNLLQPPGVNSCWWHGPLLQNSIYWSANKQQTAAHHHSFHDWFLVKTRKTNGTEDMGHNPVTLFVHLRSRGCSWWIIPAAAYQSAGLAKHTILILQLRTASQRTVGFHNNMQHPFNPCPDVS